MRRIDLTCLIASPIMAGALLQARPHSSKASSLHAAAPVAAGPCCGLPDLACWPLQYGGLRAAVIGIMAWNVAAWLPECLLLTYAQRCSPALRWLYTLLISLERTKELVQQLTPSNIQDPSYLHVSVQPPLLVGPLHGQEATVFRMELPRGLDTHASGAMCMHA